VTQETDSSEQDKNLVAVTGEDAMNGKIEVDGYQIAYIEAGSKSNPPILLIHGLMSHCGVWTSTVDTLKDNFHCIAYDQLGFGESDKPKDGDYSISKQAERTLKIADHFGFDKFIVVGHSMGGQVATHLASTSQRVSKLVSVDGVVTGKLSNRTEHLNRLLVVAADKFPALYNLAFILSKWKPYACWAFQVWFYKIKEIPFNSWELDRRKAMNPEGAHSALKAWNALNAADLTPILGNIAAPTLVIFGAQDGTVPIEQAYLFKKKLPAAELVIIDQCGHFPMYESFEAYIEYLQRFLK
jgi:pimeloyl-ACP methyl ester carboxylesterase